MFLKTSKQTNDETKKSFLDFNKSLRQTFITGHTYNKVS